MSSAELKSITDHDNQQSKRLQFLNILNKQQTQHIHKKQMANQATKTKQKKKK